MTWKPTKPGVYRLGDAVVAFTPPGYRSMTRLHGMSAYTEISTTGLFDYDGQRVIVPDGAWSLMGPEWQDGPPTIDQLMRWPWWAVQWKSGGIVVDCTDDEPGVAYAAMRAVMFGRRPIARSAPVQRDATNGPLWVPLEVAK